MIPEGYGKKHKIFDAIRECVSPSPFTPLPEPTLAMQRCFVTKFYSLKRMRFMSGSSRYTRAVSAEVGEIERRLRSLEKNLEKIGARASTHARDTAEGLGDAVASALFGWADRFRQSTSALGDQSAEVGRDATKVGARLGRGALTTVSGETERHPFFALAVAIGIGVLIGMVSKSRH